MKIAKLLGLAPLQIAQALLGFGAIAAFTRLMSAEEFGRYALALSVSMFAHTLVFTWAESAAYRFYAAAKAQNRLADHFATLLALGLTLGAAVMVITLLTLMALGLEVEVVAISLFAAAAATFRFLTRLSRETERASLAIGRYALAETAYLTLGFAAGLALLVGLHLGPAAPFAGPALAGIVIFLFDAPRLAKRAKGGQVSLARTGAYATYGAPLALAIALDLGVQALARILLTQKAGAAALGAYAAAFGLARPLDLIFMSAGAALTPLVLTAFEERGVEAARDEARKLFIVLAAFALPAATGIALLAQPIAQLLVGASLAAETARVLPWLALAGLFAGFNLYYWSEAFQFARRTSERALIMLTPGALQIALTLALAPIQGAVGAAMAAAAAAITGSVLLAALGRKRVALPVPRTDLARIALATAAMGAAVLALPSNGDAMSLTAHVVFGAAAYGAALVALNAFDARDRAVSLLNAFLATHWTGRHVRAR